MKHCVADSLNSHLLLAYCAGKLDIDTTIQMDRHIPACPKCSRLLNAQKTVWQALDGLEAPAVSPEFDRRLFARIEAAETEPWYLRLARALKPIWAQPAFPLSAAALVVVAGFVLDHPARVSTVRIAAPHSLAVRVSAAEADQVERTLDDLEMLRQLDAVSDDRESASKSM